MSSTTLKRKKSMHNFMDCYINLCQMQNTIPIPGIRVNLPNRVLDFVGDRIKLDDWRPILKAISQDRSLHYVAIRSKQVKKNFLDKVDTEEKARQVTKSPVFFTNFILSCLMDSITKLVSNSLALTCLHLERIPLSYDLIFQLVEGLQQTMSLQHLSLCHCQIGDESCNIICRMLRYHPCNLVSIDLSGCRLTEMGAGFVAEMIKIQKLSRYDETWKQSLRYRPINTEIMPGLRRITLNNNPDIGDQGLLAIIDALADDLWIKAIDFQNCGISSFGAERVLQLVKHNRCLSVVDIRANVNVIPAMVSEIIALLAENTKDDTPEFYWLQEETSSFKTTTSYYGTSSTYSQRPTSVATKKSLTRMLSVNPAIHSMNSKEKFSRSLTSKRVRPVTKDKDAENELNTLRKQLAEQTSLRIEAEKKLRDMQDVHNNSSNYIYIEKSVMQAMTQICDQFMELVVTDKHPECLDLALKLSNLITFPEKDDTNVNTMRDKVPNCNTDFEFQPENMNDVSECLIVPDTHTSYSPHIVPSSDSLLDDQSSQESICSSETDSNKSQAKLIFQRLLSARSSRSGFEIPVQGY